MFDLMKNVCEAMGVRIDVPFYELTPAERKIVFHGPMESKHILYKAKKGTDFAELDFNYYNAVFTVENALAKVKDEKGLARVAKFLREEPCADCGASRLSAAARAPRIRGIGLADACAMALDDAVAWVADVPSALPEEMRAMAADICDAFGDTAGACSTWDSATFRSTARAPRSPRESASASSSLARCATAPRACSTCSTSRRSACMPPTSTGSSA